MHSSIYGQNNKPYQLQITSLNKTENTIISSTRFNTKFKSKNSLKRTKDSVLTLLKEKGFFSLTQDSTTTRNNLYTYYIKLGEKVNQVILRTTPNDQYLLESLNLKTTDSKLTLKTEDLKSTISIISNALISNGRSFSKVTLSDILITKSKLSATLNINQSKKRTIGKVIINGYPNFPKSFLKNYFHISSNKILNSSFIDQISFKTNQLSFIKEIKKPEILFSNDSTIVYLYIKKVKSNYFDGLVNFNSENEKIKFRGYFDLNLNNTFDKGEEINIKWRNNGNNKQEFNLKSSIPYIFDTKISPSIAFNLYKHDSTYVNTKTNLSIRYPINNNINITLLAEHESSKISNSLINLQNYQKTGLGLGFLYLPANNNKFNFGIELFYKTRKTEKTNSLYQLNINTSSSFSFSKRINFLIKNTSKLTSNKTTLNNELFRSGGTNSIRGFQDNSILSNSYSYLNSELRLNTKNESYIYSIHDLGVFNINNQNKILKSIGLGYEFTRGNSKININGTFNNLSSGNHIETSIISIKMLTLF